MTVVDVADVCKSYDGRAVVDGVSFVVEEGEIFGILGPNGAGKTTLVECIGGLRRPDRGRIRVLGLDPQRDGVRLRQVLGAQLQSSALQHRLKVGEALGLYSSFYDDPLDWGELLEMLGLAGHADATFATLSGGQKQRLSIALALVGRPQVAVLDELTTGLDPQARRDTWTLIEQVRDTGVTVLLVTHFMDEAERLCDRLAIVDQGSIVAMDSPAGIISGAAGDQQLRFTPSAPLDDRLLRELVEVAEVTDVAGQLVVTGTGNVVQAVMVALARERIVPGDLRVEQQTLDDAFVALTGRLLDQPGDVEVGR